MFHPPPRASISWTLAVIFTSAFKGKLRRSTITKARKGDPLLEIAPSGYDYSFLVRFVRSRILGLIRIFLRHSRSQLSERARLRT